MKIFFLIQFLDLGFFFLLFSNRDLSSPGLGSICQSLFHILQAFKDPRTTHEEFIALKATILINSIPAAIATTKSFRLLTNQVYQSIQYTCDSNPSVYHDNYIRHFTLLLQLPHLKVLSSKLIRLFIDMRANDLLPQADLLLEMLDAQDTFDITNSFLTLNTDMNNSKTLSTYQTSKNYNQQDDTNKIAHLDDTDGKISIETNFIDELGILDQINYQPTSSSPLVYSTSPRKRSPTTPPIQFHKNPRIESTTSTNIHFSMNNSSY
jgi:hypothetical protein